MSLALAGVVGLHLIGGPPVVGIYAAGAIILGSAALLRKLRSRRAVARQRYLPYEKDEGLDEEKLGLHLFLTPGAHFHAAKKRSGDRRSAGKPGAKEPCCDLLEPLLSEGQPIIVPEQLAAAIALEQPVTNSHTDDNTKFQEKLYPDLDLAEAMANVARKAYCPPPPGQGFHTHNIVGLPQITFYRKEVLRRAFAGVVTVDLKGATNLYRADGKGPAKPYAVVSTAACSFRSCTAEPSLNPVFNTKRCLFVGNPDTDALCVRMFDDDSSTHREDLGVAVLGLASLKDGQKQRYQLPLRGPTGELGRITLDCHMQLFTDGNLAPDGEPDFLGEHPELKPSGVPVGSDGEPERGANPAGRETEWQPVAFVEDLDTDTQVWIRWKREEHRLVCAFRGTESGRDAITDLSLLRRPFATFDGRSMDKITIHRGFMESYNAVRGALTTVLQAVVATCKEDDNEGSREAGKAAEAPCRGKPWEVLLTGHSLGAALATIAAFELRACMSVVSEVKSVSLYTFGCPRVGNETFAIKFDRLIPDAWRFTNPCDIVPSVPPAWLGFCHAGHAMRLRNDGFIHFGPNTTELAAFKEAQASLKVEENLSKRIGEKLLRALGTGQVKEQRMHASMLDGATQEGVVVFSREAVRDIRWLWAFLSRRGVKDHDCTLYRDKVRAGLHRWNRYRRTQAKRALQEHKKKEEEVAGAAAAAAGAPLAVVQDEQMAEESLVEADVEQLGSGAAAPSVMAASQPAVQGAGPLMDPQLPAATEIEEAEAATGAGSGTAREKRPSSQLRVSADTRGA